MRIVTAIVFFHARLPFADGDAFAKTQEICTTPARLTPLE